MKLSILLGFFTLVSAIRQDGWCSMSGNCGKKSVFGSQLPCPTNIKAFEPDPDHRTVLNRVCGADFHKTVCCSSDQLSIMEANLKRVDPLISSCPACRKNFYDFICEFTCSPNQSTFVEITKTAESVDTHQDIVTELTQYVDPKYAKAFYDSCKNIKFSATNGFAMDLIGGGAKNFSEFLKFLGDEKPLLGGSPFQINYEYSNSTEEGLVPRTGNMKPCDDPEYKCACSDCASSCPTLPSFKDYNEKCYVGPLPCFSFSVIIVWIVFIVALGIFHINLARNRKRRPTLTSQNENNETHESETSALLQNSTPTLFQDTIQSTILEKVQNIFERLAHICASFPGTTILLSLVFSGLLLSGLSVLELETNPINLWVSPQEPALLNMQYFETHFGEWFRIEQLIVSSKDEKPILNWPNIQWWFEKESQLEQISGNVSLSDICFKPLGDTCGIQSFTQYFQGNIDYLDENNWAHSLKECAESPVNCLPTFQQPLKKNILFENDDVLESKAFTVTILVNNNSTDTQHTQNSQDYEHSLQLWVQQLQKERPDLNIAYSTEVSLTEELNKSTNTDVKIVMISYIVMFLYASLALGGYWPSNSISYLVRTRFSLGLGGIVIILLSILSSAGLCALLGLKSTLIIAEVIPFLVLAIGVDNIFLVVHELELNNKLLPHSSVEYRISQTLKKVGPSCLLGATLQFSMFLIASTVDMPAVKNFAYYSAGAILINFLLQMTGFVALLSLDQRRLEARRLDVAPWIQLDSVPVTKDSWSLGEFFHNIYGPWILSKTVKPKLLTAFLLWTGLSLSLWPNIELGFDQRLVLPQDSYLINYFNSVYKYLNVGPPVFFVVKDLDVTARANQQLLCGKFGTCDEYSLANILEQEYKRSNVSTLADPASNWLDDFLGWLNPNLDECCRVKKSSLSSTAFDAFKVDFCTPTTPSRQCVPCYKDHSPPYNATMEGLPEGKEFMTYFNQWIQEPSDPCPLGGRAPYGTSIAHNSSGISASYFRAGHQPLRSQNDFIVAYKNSLRIVDEINEHHDVKVFAFSPFYVFFVQYQSIVSQTFVLLGLAVSVIFLISMLILGWKRAGILSFVVVLVLIDMGGVMALAGISINAVSLVNLVICGGLAVEFGVHITKASLKDRDSEDDTASLNSSLNALVSVGPTTFTGITLTKLIGIFVLAFTHSKVFEVYYFRMWLGLILIAASHSLCLLPILLSYLN